MGILDRVRKTPKPKTDQTSSDAPVKKTRKKAVVVEKDTAEKVTAPRPAGRFAQTLLSPRVSEKAAQLAARGVYVFNVPLSANKVEVRKAVEALYSVNVEGVRMVRGAGKRVQRNRIKGQRRDWKKALVNLKQGQKIDLYAGV